VNSFVNPHDIVFYGVVRALAFGLPYPDLREVFTVPPGELDG
jgi:hypothetical protein